MQAVHAGLLHYLVGSDVAAAEPLLRRAAMEGRGEPAALALCALGDILEDRLDTLEAQSAWTRALLAAPESPFAEYAANRLLEVQGDSRELDDRILAMESQAPARLAPRAARFLREAAARIHGSRVGEESAQVEAAAWARFGSLQLWRVAGPFAALRLFDLRRPLALDRPDRARAPDRGPAGPTFERTLEFPDGDAGLELEPGEGDVYYAATRAVASRGGDYLALVEGAGALELRIDGTVVISRTPYPRDVPRAQAVPVSLTKGPHNVLVRWSRLEGTRFRVSLLRGDGAPSDVEDAAPAELTGQRLQGDCPLGSLCVARPAWEDRASLRGYAERLLRGDPDDPIAAWLLVRATVGDDRAAARSAVARFVAATASGAPALLVRAQESLRDPEVPERLGRTQALADLAEATRRDPCSGTRSDTTMRPASSIKPRRRCEQRSRRARRRPLCLRASCSRAPASSMRRAIRRRPGSARRPRCGRIRDDATRARSSIRWPGARVPSPTRTASRNGSSGAPTGHKPWLRCPASEGGWIGAKHS
ncbi:MAG: hypothetical protein E6J85_06165 [Deltaproteobacteria bacterium]|nr:MAG: hypothetical protein E6J85_06165 [Deltaproteobacteria bacterium]